MSEQLKIGDHCPACYEFEGGVLRSYYGKVPEYLMPPVFECNECGDLFGQPVQTSKEKIQ